MKYDSIPDESIVAPLSETISDSFYVPFWHVLHKWEVEHDDGMNVYESCTNCPKRRAWSRPGCYQPLRENWRSVYIGIKRI